jgi:hypothetical protein
MKYDLFMFSISRFILKDGSRHLAADYLKMIWITLAEQAIYPQDREQCFRWFAEVKRMNFIHF